MEDSFSLFQQLPDSILLHVFSFLDGTSLVRASSVCQQWYCVANDEVLWRHLVFVIVKKRAILPWDKGSWRGEYKRLTHHIPLELSQDVDGHQDEIYYLAFSPSGRFLASVGKDGTCRLWNYGNTVTLQNVAGPFFNPPLKTRFCEFNESETLLMVTGLTHIFDIEGSIFIAVLSMPDLSLLYAVKGEYPNFRGGWLNDTNFLLPRHFYDHGNCFKLEAHEVYVKSKKKDRNLADLFVKCRTKGRDLVVTHFNQSRCDFARVIDPKHWGNLGQYFHLSEVTPDIEASGSGFSEADGDQTKPELTKNATAMSGSDADTDVIDFDEKKPLSDDDDDSDINVDDDDDDDISTDDDIDDELSDSELEDAYLNDYALYQKMVRTAKKVTDHGQPNRTSKQRTGTGEESRPHGEVLREIVSQGRKIILMVHSSRHLEEKCFIALYAVKEDETNPGKPFKKLGVNGGILGLRLSPDQRYLVYAVRELREKDNYWGFDTDILTIVYDLILDQCQESVYMGSQATTTDHLSYIFPDLSPDLVAMGAEVIEGHLWDRHYGVKLPSNIIHSSTGPHGSGLNAVAFHPRDQETLVTAGDDRQIKVWRSKNRQAEIARSEVAKMEVKESEEEDSDKKTSETNRKRCSKHSSLFSCFSKGHFKK